MAIERDLYENTVVCDTTGERYKRTYDIDDFDRMIADIKDDGWKVVLERGRWRHYSPEAQRDEFEAFDDID
tara:strand:+ start:416 stop:628 length:213 start_codon:yes stop_codon:yes gene_type:complete